MKKSLLFLAVQFLGLVASKLAFAQVQTMPENLIDNDGNTFAADRIGNGTGTCLVMSRTDEVKVVLKQMNESQIKSVYDSLKTEAERQNLLQLLEEIQ